MTDRTADLPAALLDRFQAVPRDEPMVLDLVGTVDLGGGAPAEEVRLRILAADPLEGDREGADRFVAHDAYLRVFRFERIDRASVEGNATDLCRSLRACGRVGGW